MTVPVLTPDMRFDQAARLVLDFLSGHLPLALWSVTRVHNGRQSYLFLDEHNGYGLPQGGSHAWEDSFCIHMAAGAAPTVAPDAQAVPLYAAAAVNAEIPIGAYAGAVISEPDGSLFGALCGLDPTVRTDDPAFLAAGPLLQLLGQLLTAVLAADRLRDRAERAARQARSEADVDVLTGLLSRRGWERRVQEEGRRFARTGDPTVVAVLDLDRLKAVNDQHGHGAGDEHLRSAATALRAAVRGEDVVARLGGDEFAVLLTACTEQDAPVRIARVQACLERAAVAGSVGWAPVTLPSGFPAALARADAAMYTAKQGRRSRVGGAHGA